MSQLVRLLVLSDLATVSATNMVISITLARAFSDIEFASFGIGLTVALIVQGVQRNGFLVHLMLLTENRVRVLRHVLLGEHILMMGLIALSAIAVVVVLIALGLFDSFLRLIVISTVPSLLFFLTLDFDRTFYLKRGMTVSAAGWSVGYLAAVLMLSGTAILGHLSYLQYVALLTLYSLLKLAWLLVSTGRPDFLRGWRFLQRDLKQYLRPSLIGIAAYAGYTHVPLFVLGYTSPPIHVAAFVAMRSLVQPLQVVVRSFDLVDKHQFAQTKIASGEAGQYRMMRRQALTYLAISSALALLLCVFARPLIEFVYGANFAGFELTLYGWAIIFVILAVTLPLESVVFARGETARYFTTRLFAGAVGVVSAYPLCARYDDVGATGAVLLGSAVALLSLGWFLWRGYSKDEMKSSRDEARRIG
jgi:O-antigen/teichoic acid export membrane protein